ncbi:HYC_CC_PP family protein [Aquimarina muelleri]|nr:hypothetical protein [Aquimarina muelleri]MCX2763463.1 hypothetical protein [Aquimarina muelleri]
MKSVIHKIWSVIMALVVVFSTMSFTLDMHYCGNTLVDVAVFKKAKSCGMENSVSKSSSCDIIKKSCCTDKQVSIEGQDELKISLDKITLQQQIFITSYYFSFINPFIDLEDNIFSFVEFPPPFFVRNIYAVNESFLI